MLWSICVCEIKRYQVCQLGDVIEIQFNLTVCDAQACQALQACDGTLGGMHPAKVRVQICEASQVRLDGLVNLKIERDVHAIVAPSSNIAACERFRTFGQAIDQCIFVYVRSFQLQ